MVSNRAALALSLPLVACVESLEAPAGSVPPVLAVEPIGAYGIGPSPRLRLSTVGGAALTPAELSLFEGELSDAQVSRLRRGELPSTLVAREVPALGWADAVSGELIVRPTRFLSPGLHTLASTRHGRIGTFGVALDQASPPNGRRLTRRFPPSNQAGAGIALLCGDSTPVEGWAFSLEPALQLAELESDYGTLDGVPCVAVRFPVVPGAPAVLPPEVDGYALDPEPYLGLDLDSPAAEGEGQAEKSGSPAGVGSSVPTDCGGLALGPLCAAVEDDRLSIVGSDDTLLLRAFREHATELLLVSPGVSVALRGLVADSEQHLEGELVTRVGTVTPFELRFRTAAARPRWVLNEVLADPLGREPAAEWVEIVNASAVEADLGGLWLEDVAGRVELPALVAAAGEYLLIVRDDFAVEGRDVPPAPGVRWVEVPSIGGNGLSNTGEGLRLLDANGSVLSAFPALASRHPGVSFARRTLDTLDGDAAGFAEHAAPGASPGTSNTLTSAD